MNAPLFLVPLALLAGCSSEGEKAEERYRMVEQNKISDEETCTAARDVAKAYLQDRNDEKYREWRSRANLACNAITLRNLDLSPD